MSNQGFTIVPNELMEMLKQGEITTDEYVFMTLIFKWTGVGYFEASYSYIMEAMHVSKSTALRICNNLVAKDLIVRINQRDPVTGNQQNNRYRINGGIEWVRENNQQYSQSLNLNLCRVSNGNQNKEITSSSDQNIYLADQANTIIKEVFSSLEHIPDCAPKERVPKSSTTDCAQPSPEAVIEDFLANAGNFDLLKDRRTRRENLTELVEEFKRAGYSDFDTKYALKTLVKYAVPSSSKSFKPAAREAWEADLKKQWEITVKAAYKPAQLPVSDKIYGKTGEVNQESLNVDYDEYFQQKDHV